MESHTQKTLASFFLLFGLAAATLPILNGQSLLAQVISGQDSTRTACIDTILSQYPNISNDVLVLTKAKLNDDAKMDWIIRIESPNYCGTAGCQHELCIATNEESTAELIPFGYASKTIEVGESFTNNYTDLTLSNGLTLIWDGARYLPTE